MYVRDAKNRDEAWLLDGIERMGLDAAAFRSRDYVIAVDEESGDRAGFGRLRIHKTRSAGPTASDDLEGGAGDSDGKVADETADDEVVEDEIIELTGIGVVEEWRGRGVGAHVVERLVDTAAVDGFETVYVLTDEADYLTQFGFEPLEDGDLPGPLRDRLDRKRETVDEDVIGLRIDVEEFSMANRLRDAFKDAASADEDGTGPTESPEDFGIDPETATYKYDTGR